MVATNTQRGWIVVWDVLKPRVEWLPHVMFLVLAVYNPIARPAFCAEPQSAAVSEFETVPATLVNGTTEVWGLAASADASLLATAHDHPDVLLRDAETGNVVNVLTGHSDSVPHVAFSPDGRQLATASYDGTVKLWDVQRGRLLRTLEGHTNRIVWAAYSSNGKQLASCGYDGTIRVWQVATGQSLATMDPQASTLRSVVFFGGGQLLASAGTDGTVRMWDVASGARRGMLHTHSASVRAACVAPDGNLVATAGEDGRVRLWNVQTGQSQSTLSPATNAGAQRTMIWSLRFSPDGQMLVAGSFHGEVALFDVKSGEQLQTLTGHSDAVTAIAFSQSPPGLLTSSFDKTVLVWRTRLAAHPPLATLDIEAGNAWSIAVAPGDNTLAVAGRKGFVETWKLRSGERRSRLSGHPATVDCVEFSNNGTLLAAAGWRSKQVCVWNMSTGEKQLTLTASDLVRSIAFSPDAKLLAAVGIDKTVEFWRLPNGDRVSSTRAHRLPVYDVEFSPDGSLLATCCSDWKKPTPGTIKLWRVPSMTEVVELHGHPQGVRSVAFDPSGRWLASAGKLGRLKLWDVETRTEMKTLQNSAGVRPIAFSHNGRLLAAGLGDGTINVWSIQKGAVVRRLKGPDDVFSLRFSHDDSIIAAAGGEKKLWFWRMSPREESDTAEWIRRWAVSADSSDQ